MSEYDVLSERIQSLENEVRIRSNANEEAIKVAVATQDKSDQFRHEALEKAEQELRRTLESRLIAFDKAIEGIRSTNVNSVSRETFDSSMNLLNTERDMILEKIIALSNAEALEERMASIDETLLEVRDWKIQTETQMKLWAGLLALVVVVVNISIRLI